MNREQVLSLIRAHLADELEIDPASVSETTRLRQDLEADSLDLSTLVQELETSYGVKISDEEAARILTVGQAVDFVLASNAATVAAQSAPASTGADPEGPSATSSYSPAAAIRSPRVRCANCWMGCRPTWPPPSSCTPPGPRSARSPTSGWRSSATACSDWRSPHTCSRASIPISTVLAG